MQIDIGRAGTPGKIACLQQPVQAGDAEWMLPWCAIPGITLENAMPIASAGSRKTNPASGPAMPISNRMRFEKIAERMRMNAPKVPSAWARA